MPTPQLILSEFIQIFPDFEAEWKSDNNCSINSDGSFTFHGLFIEFSHYFYNHFEEMSLQSIQKLCNYIEQFLHGQQAHESDDDVHDSINNAICTCFLENLGRNPSWNHDWYQSLAQKEELRKEVAIYTELPNYLGPKSASFYFDWHGLSSTRLTYNKPSVKMFAVFGRGK